MGGIAPGMGRIPFGLGGSAPGMGGPHQEWEGLHLEWEGSHEIALLLGGEHLVLHQRIECRVAEHVQLQRNLIWEKIENEVRHGHGTVRKQSGHNDNIIFCYKSDRKLYHTSDWFIWATCLLGYSDNDVF